MKKLLFILLLLPFFGNSQVVNFSTRDSNFLWTYRNSSGVYNYGKGRPMFANELTRNTSTSLKAIVFDSVAWSTKTPPYFFYQNIGGGSSISHYVDSVSNNAGGDSLVVVYGSGTRRAYVYPSGSASNWVNSGSDAYLNAKATIGATGIDARLHVVTTSSTTPYSTLGSGWGVNWNATAASGSTGFGFGTAIDATNNIVYFVSQAPGVAWGGYNFRGNTYRFEDIFGTLCIGISSNAQVGLGPVPNYYSVVQMAGSVGYSYTQQSGTYSITGNDHTIEYGSTGGHTYTLPTVSSATGREYVIINSGTGALNVATTSSQAFENMPSSPTTYVMPPKSSIHVISNSTGWMVTGFSGRNRDGQGADVASANNLALGSYGNVFSITGTTQINLLTTTGFLDGDEVKLIFTSTPTVKNNQTTSGSNVKILLAGGADFSATADDVLTLVLSTSGGTQAWREVSRSVN